MKAWEIVAVAFDADLWCPECSPCPCGGADPCTEHAAGRDGCSPVFASDAESDTPECCGHCGAHLYGPDPEDYRDREALTAALVAAGLPQPHASRVAESAMLRAFADDAVVEDLCAALDLDPAGVSDDTFQGAVAAFEDRDWARCIAALRSGEVTP